MREGVGEGGGAMKSKRKPRTASILITDDELRWIRRGEHALYRPISDHWEGQLRKFTRPKVDLKAGIGQVTLIPFDQEAEEDLPDIVHLVLELEGEKGKYKKKAESRILTDIFDNGRHPDTGERCWVLDLGKVVEVEK